MDHFAYHFTVNFKVAKAEKRLDIDIFKRDKTEPFASTGLSVEHDSSIDNFAELGKIFPHRLRRHTTCKTANKQFGRSLVLLAWYRSLRVDLG